jgi:hypothetical protein
VVVWRRGQRKPQARIDGLVSRIAELDLLHQQGQINHDAYQRQRQDLKTLLAELMRGETRPPTE